MPSVNIDNVYLKFKIIKVTTDFGFLNFKMIFVVSD